MPAACPVGGDLGIVRVPDLPVGPAFGIPVKPSIEKYFCLSEDKIRCRVRPILPTGGAYASPRTLGSGCDGRAGYAGEAKLMRTAKACGPDLPMPGSSRRVISTATVAIKAGHRRERAISRNPLRREGRHVSAYLYYSCAFCAIYLAHGAAGAACIRPSLRPPFSGRAVRRKTRAFHAARMRSRLRQFPLTKNQS